ncbi:MAG: UDP-3-O-acyl-N-acetylglucosamine deacetylase [Acidobacteriota bacterium]|nr:UDP-3-O-acyl-N-acetylglucosamine deacetylase [Acidobacteriota bacterium]
MAKHPDSFFIQRTISRPVGISGVGIHSGADVHLELHPAPPDAGICFRRVDCGIEIQALSNHVSSLELATTLGKDDVQISTVEHLMAAVAMCGVDNLFVDLDGPEVPILDGSALPYCRLLAAAGFRRQDALRKIMAITSPIEVDKGDGRAIRLSPYPGLRVTYGIDYGDFEPIGHQTIDVEVKPVSFERDLAPARTFGLLRDVERMHEAGLGLGGNENNCIVYDDQGPINTQLRFDDEPVRHKALDALGDLALTGSPIWGHLEVERGGHALHFSMLEALEDNRDCWTWMGGETTPLRQPVIQRAPLRIAASGLQ